MAEENTTSQPAKNQKPVVVFLIFIIVIGLLALAFFFGLKYRQTPGGATPMPTPTPEVTNIPSSQSTPTPEEVSPTPTSQVAATPTPTITPTPSPSASPTPAGGILRWVGPLYQLFKPSETQTLGATASLDGFMASNYGGNNTLEIRIGRNNYLIYRGFVSFDLTALPNNITVEKAVLKIYQAQIMGSPYGVGGNLIVDHLDYETSLESSDYNRAAIVSDIGVLANNASLGRKELEVTERVKDDLSNSRTRSQYRLRFATETIGGSFDGDVAYFESQENTLHTGNWPQLEVTFKRN